MDCSDDGNNWFYVGFKELLLDCCVVQFDFQIYGTNERALGAKETIRNRVPFIRERTQHPLVWPNLSIRLDMPHYLQFNAVQCIKLIRLKLRQKRSGFLLKENPG